jgi:hypothetical protein
MTTRTTIQINVAIPGFGGFLPSPEGAFESAVIIISVMNSYNTHPGAQPATHASYCRFRRAHISAFRQHLRQIQTCDADPIVGHAVVDIEAIR